jgi:ATP-dependent DNA helicase RecQ
MFMVTRDELYQVKMQSEKEEEILRTMLRLYTGIFSEFRPIDEMEIATLAKQSHEEVHEFLKRMWRAKVIRYIPSNHDPLIYLNEERLPAKDIYIAPETYTRRKALMMERLQHLILYTNESDECRSRIIENYFCGTKSEPCGICDNCLARKRREKGTNSDTADYERQIIELLSAKPMDVKELVSLIRGNEQVILATVSHLIEEQRLRVENRVLVVKS